MGLWSVLQCSSGALQATRGPISLSEMRLTIQRIAIRACSSPQIHRQEAYRVTVKAVLCPLHSPLGCAQLREPLDQEIRSKSEEESIPFYAAYTPLMYRSTKSTPDIRNQSASFVATEFNNLVVLSWKRQTNEMVDSMHHAISRSRFMAGPSM